MKHTRPFYLLAITLLIAIVSTALPYDLLGAVTTVSYWRMGENDPGVASGAATNTTDPTGLRTMKFQGTVAYDTAVSPAASAMTASTWGISFSGNSYGTNAVINSLTDNFGMELWVKPNNTTGSKCLAYTGRTGSSGWGLYQVGNTYQVLFGGVAFFGSGTVTVGTWTHVAMVRSSGTTTLYVNGVPAGTSTATPNTAIGLLAFGAAPPDLTGDYLNGSLDEIRIFTFSPGAFSTNDLLYKPVPPVVTTLAATNVSGNSATLNATVDTKGLVTSAYYEYGTSTNYGNFSITNSVAATNTAMALPLVINNLNAGTLYHFRVVATNSAGKVTGSNLTFTTTAIAPTVTTLAATQISGNNATLNGSVNPNGLATTTYFEYAEDTNFNVLPTIANPSFEANNFTVFPGYASGNGGVISGWSLSAPASIGINPSGGNPFADNGAVPNGTKVAFIQSNGSVITLSTIISNLVVGRTYRVTFRANCRAGQGPMNTTWSLNNEAFVPFTAYPAVGGTNPYYTISNTFTATANTATVAVRNSTVGDTSLLVDDFSITADYGAGATSNFAATHVVSAFTNVVSGLKPLTTYYFRAVGNNSAGTAFGSTLSFATTTAPPTASTMAATEVTATNAMLNASVNPGGDAVSAYFEYGTETNYGSLSTTNSLVATNTAQSVSILVSSLTPGTLYHYRIVAKSSTGITTGADLTFSTPPLLPTVTTLAATGITFTNATLNANVNPGNGATTVYFSYGLTTNYGSSSATTILTGTNITVATSSVISNLAPATLYHFRVVAANSAGTVSGANLTFTTATTVPSAITQAPTGTTASSSTLRGTVNPNGLATEAYFEYGTDTSYGSLSTTNSLVATNTAQSVSILISSLTPGTLYHYRIVAKSSAGISTGTDVTFTTPPLLPVVTTLAATEIGVTNATLNAEVNPGNGATAVHFRYGVTTNYGFVSATTNLTATNITIGVSNLVRNLTTGTLYHFQAVAINSAGTAFGTNLTFTTEPTAPSVITLPATFTATNATLNGTVNPNGLATLAYFEYGTDTNYGSFSATNNLTATNTSLAISDLVDLSPTTQYHFRLVATNSAGSAAGTNLTFTTIRLPMVANITNTADNGPGSLRQAILESIPDDTIVFDAGLSGSTIQLTSGQLVLTNRIAIDASTLPGGLRLNGNGGSRIFQINDSATVTLTALTMSNGGGVTNGGAIHNAGNLIVDRCTIVGNSVTGNSGGPGSNGSNGGAGGTGGAGSYGSGGGIFNSGILTVNQCTITGNHARGGNGGRGGDGGSGLNNGGRGGNGGSGGQGEGAAIYNAGTLALNQSTLASNTTSGGTGGGGGFGGDGFFGSDGSNGSTGSTGGATGGGIYRHDGPANLFNSIVANNTPNNLFGTITQTGVNITSGNPILGALGNNGGPTQTMPPLSGSPAFDTAAVTTFSTDQRGLPRVMGNAPDIGAVEMIVPNLSTLAASDITDTTATLNGTVNPYGVTSSFYFQYGTTTNFGSVSSTSVSSANEIVAVAISIGDLQPATTYYFRFVAFNAFATVHGSNLTFTTQAGPPIVVTQPAVEIGIDTATLKGTVNPSGLATSARFEYGTTTNYGSVTPFETLTATNTTLAITNLISGLSPGTLYHYRLVATNSVGVATGADLTFRAKAGVPVATTLAATAITGTSARLNAIVNPGNGEAIAYFAYTTDTNSAVDGIISNPSFELNNFTAGAGYASLNGGVISGWSISNPNATGLNPANGSPFADNGAIPAGGKVAFIQSFQQTNTISTTISNLNSGGAYQLKFRANCRTGSAPTPVLSVNGGAFSPFTASPAVGGGNAYYSNSVVFTATGGTAELVMRNYSTNDTTVLLDDFSVVCATPYRFSATNTLAATDSDVSVSTVITGLEAATTYYFYVVSVNSSGTATGSILTFTTGIAAPKVTTLAATEIDSTTARLNGTVNPLGDATAYFEYGTTTNYGRFSATNQLEITNAVLAVSNLVGNLLPNTQYHFRMVAENEANIAVGSNLTFTTSIAAPTITPLTATIIGTNAANGFLSVELSALVRPNGSPTIGYFEYGRTTAYAGTNNSSTVSSNIVQTNISVTVSFSAGFSYHWRVVAENSVGTDTSPDQAFNLGNLKSPSDLPGDLNGDGIISQEELDTIYGHYFTNSPWLYMTNVAGLGGTNVTFGLDNSVSGAYNVEYSTNLVEWFPLGPATPRYLFIDTNAPALPQRHYRLRYP